MKIDVVKLSASLIVILALLMCSSVATETTWRHSGFELWGYDINYTNMNATNVWVLDFEDNGVPGLSASDSGILYYNDTNATMLVSVNGSAYSEMQTADMKNIAGGIAGLDTSAKIPAAYLDLTIISSNYTGDNSANRAIPHGLTTIPSAVFITGGTGTVVSYYVLIPTYACINLIFFQNTGTPEAQTVHSVTAMDATNVYVGNVAAYYKSANAVNYEYTMLVIP